jgi:5-methylthioadenosine/S-adenosylhomocysteine deaminase
MPSLILHAHVVTMNATRDVFDDGYVLVADDGRIAGVGPAAQAPAADGHTVIEARGMIAIPGLVNAHQHLWQHLMMGAPPLAGHVMQHPTAASLQPGDLRTAATLAAAEMLAGGTTCVLHHMLPGSDPQALADTIEPLAAFGMRQTVAIDHPTADPAALEAARVRWHGADAGRVRLALHVATDVSAVARGRVHERDIAAAYAFAMAHGLRLTTLATSGESSVAWESAMARAGRSGVMHMMELGVLDSRWMLVHADRLSATDVSLMRESGCHAVATPIADAVRGQGSSTWTALARAGVPCALASDGPARSCTVDMVEQMKAMVLVQNTVLLDPTAQSAEAALEMATLGGARALGLDHEIGSLEPGKRADIAVFDMRGPHFQAMHKPISGLVCCARGSDVHMVLVDGRIVWRDGRPAAAWDPETLALDGQQRSASWMARVAAIPAAALV